MNDADEIANLAFQLMQGIYPDQFQRCVAEARAQLAEEELKNLREKVDAKRKEEESA